MDDHLAKPEGGYDWLDLFPLARGPSQKARFLAKFGSAGCGSGVGVGYYAYGWDPQSGILDEFVKLEGAQSQFDAADKLQGSAEGSFPPIGKLQTEGPIITLPFCQFSAVDTWDNPSLCAVYSYDISGDRPKFIGSVWNRPDLLPIAKAIEHAAAHDYPAVLAYCGSPDVASRIVREMPPSVLGVAGFEIKRISEVLKRVELGDGPTFLFDVEKQGDRWLVVGFQTD